jgi:hypothetical protein
MEETAKKKAAKDFWLMAARQYKPSEMARLEQERRQLSDRLFASFAKQADGGELVLTLRDLITNCFAFAHYLGIRRGYKIAEGLAKQERGKAEHRAKAKIARVLLNKPQATTREIFLALDNAEIPLHRSSSVPKGVRLWSDVVDEPYYKNLVSRVRKQVARATRLRNWQKLMDKHEEMRTQTG